MTNQVFSPNDKEMNNVQQLTPVRKYDYFIGKVADWELAWTIGDKNLATAWDDERHLYLPLWPAEAYAKQCLIGEWAGFSPIPLTLEHLMSEILPDMIEANISAAIMLFPDVDKPLLYRAKDVLYDLSAECEQYE